MAQFLDALIVCVLTLLGGEEVQIPSLKQDPPAEVDAHRQRMQNTVYPWYDLSETGTFSGVGDVTINYRIFPSAAPSNMALFFLHGASEVMDKYAEFLYDIRQLQPGYDIYFMEHRGMGSSGRLISESKYLYVDDFDNYVRDAKTFYDTVISANNAYFKVFIWAHSLGAAVATSYAQKYRNDIQGLVISSPMMEILTKFPLSLDEDVAYTTTCASTLIGQGEQLALGQELPDTLVDPTSKESWERETVTTSWKRWTVFQELLVNNQDWLAGGGGSTWGSTNGFAKEAYSATFSIRKRKNARRITAPILMFQAGKDFIVGAEGQNTLKKNARNARSFTVVEFEDGYHELYLEKDRIRDQVLNLTSNFLDTF